MMTRQEKPDVDVRFLVMDVDGTLTNGKIYIGSAGELFKAFDAKDGYGIKFMLPAMDILPVVITARESAAVALRCKELDIVEVHQGAADKMAVLSQILEAHSLRDGVPYSLSDVAYIGDDVLDLQCMMAIADVGGIAACPSDAIPAVKRMAAFVSNEKGGEGAVRDFIEYLSVRKNR